MPAQRLGAGIGAQVALARQESPHRGGRHLGLGKVLVSELPHTHAAMRAGRLSEWRATLIARETACLSVEHRAQVDAELCADVAALDGCGDRRLAARARTLAYQLDPRAAMKRARSAESDRRVSIRPAPDTMAWISALLPVADGVAVYAALRRAADTARRCPGDLRTRGQVMADALTAGVTGRPAARAPDHTGARASADDAADADADADVGLSDAGPGDAGAGHRAPGHRGRDHGGRPGLMITLVLTDRSLFGGGDEVALIPGYGPVPAGYARGLIADQLERDPADRPTSVFLRRLYTAPSTGSLVGMDSRARRAPRGLSRLLRLRDQSCRQPWCDAPIRHDDHVTEHARGGATSIENLQGLCEACNYAKTAPGWTASAPKRVTPASPHAVTVTTPTGHMHVSTEPGLPRAGPRASPRVEPRAGPAGSEPLPPLQPLQPLQPRATGQPATDTSHAA